MRILFFVIAFLAIIGAAIMAMVTNWSLTVNALPTLLLILIGVLALGLSAIIARMEGNGGS